MATLEQEGHHLALEDGVQIVDVVDAGPADNANTDTNKVNKRSRWATRKMTLRSSRKKRQSIIGRTAKRLSQINEKKRTSGGTESLRQPGDDDADSQSSEDVAEPRTVYFNLPLPPELKDEDGSPKVTYPRNKIRTAKYTPLSFIPKDLWFQFHNIANIFFLFTVILVIFPIFNGINPGLNAVPLIVIITITAIKDAFEDYSRTKLDNELNNAPVHRLLGYENVNVEVGNVSLWRRFKKANTRGFGLVWHLIERSWNKDALKKRTYGEDNPRVSIETTRQETNHHEPLRSPFSNRQSFVSAQEEIQMTPYQEEHPNKQARPVSGMSTSAAAQRKPIKGDLMNHDMAITGTARFHPDAWKNLVVGDFVRVYNNDEVPADIVILSTSDADGACYVETKGLDGETNLKVRTALRAGRGMHHARDCERAQFWIESEGPQSNLYKYSGAIRWKQKVKDDRDSEPEEMSEPITIDNLLLRGVNLRNTEWALGVVVFTGHDTKIIMNSGETPSKRSRIARELNFSVIYNFVILFAMCLIAALINGAAWARTDSSASFFELGPYGGSPGIGGFITFWAAIILFQNLVPISLYISLEIVRTLQAIFIYSDVEMYYEKTDQPCVPKTWNISDDVGQIEYIFSDKTGTLTQNVMEFKKATVNGQPYGEAYTEAQAGMRKRLGIDVTAESAKARSEIAEAKERALRSLREINDNPYLHDDNLTFVAPDYVEDLAGKHGEEQQKATEHFMLVLALCHTVVAEKLTGDKPNIIYKAQSPDEAALVATARDMGFTVLSQSADGIDLNVMGHERHYEVLNVIEFNSTRKRMSAIVRMPDGRIMLFCKGADSVIWKRLKRGEQAELRQATAEHLEMFAREGLRTLGIAERELDEEHYKEWRKEHDQAATALEDREEKLEAVADSVEQELTLLGGTAIEDRLQDGVPDAIALLADAGIKLWVLTGDKVETAINIGFSCNLLNTDMELIRLEIDEDDSGTTSRQETLRLVEADLDKYLHEFGLTGSDEELKKARKDHEAPPPTHALVIDGTTLKWVLDETLKQKFLLLCKQCKSVLCCRVSPAQKAEVVGLVKQGLDVMTLSIGDGANDVAMIQEADVGVGIAGVEGRQAVMASDYGIGQFRFLERLVLVHGRWSYRRIAETIPNFFYKNMVWVWAIFWYQIFCNFDMTYIFDYTYIIEFNLFYTSVPVILLGVLDQDVSDVVSLAVPQLYRRGIERAEWTQTKFWLYMLDGVYQSIMSYFIPYLTVIGAAFISGNGLEVTDRERFGMYIASPAVITINLYILMNTYRWDWLMLLVIGISDVFIFLWTGLYTITTYSGVFYKAAPQVYGELTFWLVMLITPAICVFPRFVLKTLQKVYRPYDVDIIREQVRLGMFRDGVPRPGAGATPGSTEQALVKGSSTGSRSSDTSRKNKASRHAQYASVDEDRRPIYPPSVATHNTRTQNGSDGTDYTGHPQHDPTASMDLPAPPLMPAVSRPSIDRARPSYDRMRASMDRVRPSFEASHDFTSAARLSRIESSHSAGGTYYRGASGGGAGAGASAVPGRRAFPLIGRARGLSAFSKKSQPET